MPSESLLEKLLLGILGLISTTKKEVDKVINKKTIKEGREKKKESKKVIKKTIAKKKETEKIIDKQIEDEIERKIDIAKSKKIKTKPVKTTKEKQEITETPPTAIVQNVEESITPVSETEKTG